MFERATPTTMDKDMGITSGKRSREEEQDVPMPPQVRDPRPMPTNEDSLQFMGTMKCELAKEREKYYEFIAVIHEFKYGGLDLASLVDRVKALLAGHPNLIKGFNEFLPWDYMRSQVPADGGSRTGI